MAHTNASGRFVEQKTKEEQEKEETQTDEMWDKIRGAMVLRKGGKSGHSLCVVVLAEKQVGESKKIEELELKPSVLVRKLLLYIMCEYIKCFNQAAEVVVVTIPGMIFFVVAWCASVLMYFC